MKIRKNEKEKKENEKLGIKLYMDIADESLRSPLGNISNSEKFDENSGKKKQKNGLFL